MKTDGYYLTADLWLACFLMAMQVGFRGIRPSDDGRHFNFRFAVREDLDDLVNKFFCDGECSVKLISANYRFLSGLVRQAKRNGGGGL